VAQRRVTKEKKKHAGKLPALQLKAGETARHKWKNNL